MFGVQIQKVVLRDGQTVAYSATVTKSTAGAKIKITDLTFIFV